VQALFLELGTCERQRKRAGKGRVSVRSSSLWWRVSMASEPFTSKLRHGAWRWKHKVLELRKRPEPIVLTQQVIVATCFEKNRTSSFKILSSDSSDVARRRTRNSHRHLPRHRSRQPRRSIEKQTKTGRGITMALAHSIFFFLGGTAHCSFETNSLTRPGRRCCELHHLFRLVTHHRA